MTPTLIQAAVGLADVLTRENEALRAMDLATAAAMLGDKTLALETFVAAQRGTPAGSAVAASGRDIASRLSALAAENRSLLERGIAVQGKLLGLLGRAAQPVPSRYGAHGAPAFDRKRAAIALSARA